MTREEAINWLDKQIAIDILARDNEDFYSDGQFTGIARCGISTQRDIHVWVRYDKHFYALMEAIQTTATFTPDNRYHNVIVSFMYKGYRVFTLLDSEVEE